MTVRALRRGALAKGAAAPAFSGLAVAALTQSQSNVDGSVYTTASVAPAANRLVCVWVAGTGGADAGVTVSGNGITYTLAGSSTWDLTGRQYLYVGSSATPSAGAITITFDVGRTGAGWRVEEWSGSVTPTVRQAKGGAGAGATTASITLDATPQASSATVLWLHKSHTNTTNPGTDFTETMDTQTTSPASCWFHEYDIGPVDAVCDCSWTGAIGWRGLAAEIGGP